MSFVIALKDEFVRVEGDYSFMVQAVAQGGALASAPGVMSVTPEVIDCTGSFVGVPQSEYRFDLPREGTDIQQVLFEDRDVYVSAPRAGCS